jgi:hypothetical protein
VVFDPNQAGRSNPGYQTSRGFRHVPNADVQPGEGFLATVAVERPHHLVPRGHHFLNVSLPDGELLAVCASGDAADAR